MILRVSRIKFLGPSKAWTLIFDFGGSVNSFPEENPRHIPYDRYDPP